MNFDVTQATAGLLALVAHFMQRLPYMAIALVVFFNYGIDTGTVWKSEPCHEPILWRHVS